MASQRMEEYIIDSFMLNLDFVAYSFYLIEITKSPEVVISWAIAE